VAGKRQFRIVLGEGPQKGALGGSLSRYVPPGAQYEYKPPSVFARYRVLSIVFALLVIALLLYGVMAPRHDRRLPAPAATPPASAPGPTAPQPDPVYVLPVSPKAPPRQ
jgi:hypothetical protein